MILKIALGKKENL